MCEGCLPVGDIKYIVELVDSTGEVVEQMVVTSDSCINGTCSKFIPPGTCLAKVQATSPFGNFSTEVIHNVQGKIWPPTTFFPISGTCTSFPNSLITHLPLPLNSALLFRWHSANPKQPSSDNRWSARTVYSHCKLCRSNHLESCSKERYPSCESDAAI